MSEMNEAQELITKHKTEYNVRLNISKTPYQNHPMNQINQLLFLVLFPHRKYGRRWLTSVALCSSRRWRLNYCGRS